mmetsp:Transcript_59188/g.157196  ORF Transcript_59188/g.157196 Transcript_59188/m.157196 type:complete len:119 (+) Transcript_59188:242-598(+)
MIASLSCHIAVVEVLKLLQANTNTPMKLASLAGAQVLSFQPASGLPLQQRGAVRDEHHEHPLTFTLKGFGYYIYECDRHGLSAQCYSVLGKARGPRYWCSQCQYDVCPACGETLEPVL